MSSLSQYLSSMLARRGMKTPNAQMLFEYRLNVAEFEELRNLLRQFVEAQQQSYLHFPNESECAAFILYAAEWWRRKYAGGLWRWDQIYASLSNKNIQFAPNDRAQTVERGLRFWGLRMGSVGKKFFGALVVQGGLPLQMIAQGDGAVAGLLIRSLRFAQQFNWDDAGLMRFFEENNKALIQHIREPEIYRLLASIVLTVIGLRRDHELAGLSDPVGELDRKDPDWQNRFPIALDDGSAGPLLIALIKEAAREVQRHGGSPFLVSRYLESTGEECFRLTSVVRIPNAVPLDELASLCRLPSDNFPRYFRFDLMVSKRSTLCEARTVLSAGSSIVALNGLGKSIIGPAAALEHMLICRCEGVDLNDPVGLPGGASLDDEMPWIFANRNDVLVLVAVGSCRLPDEKLIVVLDESSALTCVNDNSSVLRLGLLELEEHSRVVYEVTGTAHVTLGSDGSVLRFQTKQGVVPPDLLVWHGKRIPYPSRPWSVFLETPRLYSYAATGEIAAVPAKNMEWNDIEGNTINDLRSHRGPLVAWILQDGIRSSRFRMVIEDANATINLLPGENESTGSICLQNWAISDIGANLDLEQVPIRRGKDVTLTVSAAGNPPPYLNVQLLWRSNWPGITLTVPFPASGGRFIDAYGHTLQNNTSIALSRILGLRINVFDRNQHHAKTYRIELELKSTTHSSRQAQLNTRMPFPVDLQGFGELRLVDIRSQIESLFCQSDQLDSFVMVRLANQARSIASIQVTRYDCELLKSGTRFEMPQTAFFRTETVEVGSASMLALLLFDANANPTNIEYTNTGDDSGYWDVELLGHEKSSWLLYPSPTSSIQFRPIFYRPIIFQKVSIEVFRCPLGTGMELGDPAIRQEYLSHIVNEMAVDIAHPSWELLNWHYHLLAHLPLSTLDSWRILARNPRACLMCLFKFSVEVIPALSHRLAGELGVVWELMPRQAILDNVAALKNDWKSRMGDGATQEILRVVTESQLKSIVAEIPSLATSISLARFHADLCGPENVASIEREMSKGIDGLLGRIWTGPDCLLQRLLLRGHAEDAGWPNFGIVFKAIEEFETFLDEATKSVIKAHMKALFWMPHSNSGQQVQTNSPMLDVANLPTICALWTYFGGASEWWREENRLLEVRSIRDFDPVWFEEIYKNATVVCVAIDREAANLKKSIKQLPVSGAAAVDTRHATGPDFSKARRIKRY
jgi:hypothetical protein